MPAITLLSFLLAVTTAPIIPAGAVTDASATRTGDSACRASKRVIAVIVDGLRPDMITRSRMPALAALGQRGTTATAHHSIFPTVTRVNAASLVTGTTPGGHGLLGNTIYLPAVTAERTLSTGSANDMRLADSALSGRLLTAPTIHDVLHQRGLRSLVASAGSSGSAYVLGAGGHAVVLNTELTIPAERHATVLALLGEPPVEGRPNTARNARAVDALLSIGLDSLCADVAYLWLSDPDHTPHADGIGSVASDASLTAVDAQIARLLAGLEARGLRANTDVLVVSDHGFSTHAGSDTRLRAVLAPFANDAVIAEGAVYFRTGHEHRLSALVVALQQSPEIGPVFTMDGASGTLRYDAIGWQHARSGHLLFGSNWSHAANAAGWAGSTTQSGVAGHGSSSPYDVRATFLAAGPSFRRGIRTSVPTSNADVAPTVFALLGLPVPRTMDGRVVVEMLRRTPPAVARARVQRDSTVAETVVGDMRYRVTLHRSSVGRARYVDSTVTVRGPARPAASVNTRGSESIAP